MTQSISDGLADGVIDGLAHLIAGADERVGTRWPQVAIQSFDGFELLDSKIGDPDDYILLGDNPLDFPIWPIDVRWGGRGKDGWYFKSVRTLHPRNWRGRLRRVLPRMVEVGEAFIDDSAKMVGSVAPIGLTGTGIVDLLAHNHPAGARRVAIPHIYGAVSKNDERYNAQTALDIDMAQGISLRREYLWSVLLGEPGIPRARFSTDPTGVRQVFKLRDIPPGKERRTALRHWVSEHWRKRRPPSADDWIFVKAHLRGAHTFVWQNLHCTIEPSRRDLIELEKS